MKKFKLPNMIIVTREIRGPVFPDTSGCGMALAIAPIHICSLHFPCTVITADRHFHDIMY